MFVKAFIALFIASLGCSAPRIEKPPIESDPKIIEAPPTYSKHETKITAVKLPNDDCEVDDDGDGIAYGYDSCPNEPETINGIDDDGCPDDGASIIRITKTKIEILAPVSFRTAKAEIRSESFGLLNQVVTALKHRRLITKIEVASHSDGPDEEWKQRSLSHDRARAVRDYLIAKGIRDERVEFKDYGEQVPIASNRTKEGRALNRRIEFNILETKDCWKSR